MGCDIHLIVEQKRGDRWVAIRIPQGWTTRPMKGQHNWNYPLCLGRNYKRFAALAGVRGNGPDPRGVPDDLSETGRALINEWGVDGHSHSWLGLEGACKLFLETEFDALKEFVSGYPQYSYFALEESDLKNGECRIVYWFDN